MKKLFYAKIGHFYVTNDGYSIHPNNLAKFATPFAATANAHTMLALFKPTLLVLGQLSTEITTHEVQQ